jgi:small subunit ribosomal protein S8
MSLNDLMSDFVARINNAVLAEKNDIEVLKNKLVLNVCKKLTSLGYLNSFEEHQRTVTVSINFEKTHKLKRISKPGQRVYTSHLTLPKIIGGQGFNIISSSQGIISSIESKKNKVGGELLFQIY